MILAAGLGTRLGPLTKDKPKALVEVDGKPMLGRLMEKLTAAGYDDIVINVHHFAEQIVDYVNSNNSFGVKVRFSDESDILRETGGAIRHAAALLEDADGPVLIHNVDIDSNVDLSWLRKQVRPADMASVLVSERRTSRYFLFDSDMRLAGWTNVDSGIVRSPYPSLDAHGCLMRAFSGIHLISPAILPLMNDWPEKFSTVDFYLSLCREHSIRGIQAAEDFKVTDLGKIELFTSRSASV